jgi:hypothetical protein
MNTEKAKNPEHHYKKYECYAGLGQTKILAQHHPDIASKPHFKDMLIMA